MTPIRLARMAKLKTMWVPLLIVAVAYYALPALLFIDHGLAFIMLLAILPLITLFAGALEGARNGLNAWFVLAVAALFAPTIFIYYNSSAAPYIAAYALMAAIGVGIGTLFRGPSAD